MIELYHHGSSVCAAKVRLYLEEKRLSWQGHYIDILKGEQFTPEYRKLNPKSVVPTLVHDERTIRESSVICEYLDDVFAEHLDQLGAVIGAVRAGGDQDDDPCVGQVRQLIEQHGKQRAARHGPRDVADRDGNRLVGPYERRQRRRSQGRPQRLADGARLIRQAPGVGRLQDRRALIRKVDRESPAAVGKLDVHAGIIARP
jgi:glutathione S-transferase